MITAPDDDTPETPTFSPLTPAIPSRATQQQPAPMFEYPEVNPPVTIRRVPRRRALVAPKPQPALKRRKAPVKKAKTVKRAKQSERALLRAATARVTEPKNRNRPREMKERLTAVLSSMATMTRPEAKAFTEVMQLFEPMARSSRKSLIAALQQVYG